MRRAVALILLAACGGGGEEILPPDAAPPVDAAPPDAPAVIERPTRLSQAGLYADFAGRVIAADLVPFEPAYALWSDGLIKRRWIRLPAGAEIDKSDPDHWHFPIGTQLWKEFATAEGVLLETRLIERTGPGEDDFWMGSFVWEEDDGDAIFAPDGATDVRGTDHDPPSTVRCGTCHNGEPGKILGFSAVQQGATAPGDPIAAAALGYLHGNCGHCHNERGSARPDTDMILRLGMTELTPEATSAYLTTIGVDTQYFRDPMRPKRVVAGDPDKSALLFRMLQRGDTRQMPPIATEHIDETGAAAVRAWIDSLSD